MKTKPLFRPLTPQAARDIDRTGREILSRIGMRVVGGDRDGRLAAAGCRVDGESVRFPSDTLDALLARAPRRFTMHSRDGSRDLLMGAGRVHFGNGGRVFRIIDMATGDARMTTLADVAATAALVEALDQLDFYVIACQAHELGPENYHTNDFFQAFDRTAKHVMGGCDDLAGARQMLAVASAIAGGEQALAARPFVSVMTNSISPLTVEGQALAVLEFCCEKGIPATCAPAPISAVTAPATLAGTLAQLHAEALAGVALAQALVPGAKVLYGAVATSMDLRTMEFCLGSAEGGVMNACAVQLAHLYGLPIYASAGVSEAKRPNIQSGMERGLSDLLVALAGGDYVHLAAGMLDSANAICLEQYVADNELIGMVRRITDGVRVDQDTLGLEAITRVGPGGNYLTDDHTLEYMESEYYYPPRSVRCNFQLWEERGRPDLLTRSRELVQKVLAEDRHLLPRETVERVRRACPGLLEP